MAQPPGGDENPVGTGSRGAGAPLPARGGGEAGCPEEGGSSRAQVLHAVAERLLQAHDDGHLHEQVHHAATEMALQAGQGREVRPGGAAGWGQGSRAPRAH